MDEDLTVKDMREVKHWPENLGDVTKYWECYCLPFQGACLV